jgi:hypothetical protein
MSGVKVKPGELGKLRTPALATSGAVPNKEFPLLVSTKEIMPVGDACPPDPTTVAISE